jgi:hypothetical protein
MSNENNNFSTRVVLTLQDIRNQANLIEENIDNNYLTQSSASGTYLTQSSASGTYATLSSPNFSGIVTADNYDIRLTTLNSDSIVLNFSSGTGLFTRSAAGTITFTASNYREGAIKTIRIVAGGSSRNFTFPTNWVFVGEKPANIAANKTGILTVTSFGTTEANCVAAWAVQP